VPCLQRAFCGRRHAGNLPPVQTVFVILFENHNWARLQGSADAPFINGTLLPLASHCEQYFNRPGLHPERAELSLAERNQFRNFLAMIGQQFTTNTPTSLARNWRSAGISWKGLSGDIRHGGAVGRHQLATRRNTIFVYFDDLTGTNDPNKRRWDRPHPPLH